MTTARGARALHHIGIAVRSIAEALPHWTEALGLELVSTDVVENQGVRIAVLRAGPVRIELLEPLGASSPVQRFLDKRGPGLHHLAFEVPDCAAAIARLTAHGRPMIDGAPVSGAHGWRVAFAHPKGMSGVLTELVEDPTHG
jgi:methylmalonyl-CoA epimerase